MPDWVQTGFTEYLRRFPKDMPFVLIEIPAGKRGKNADIKRILDKEGEQMLAAAGKNRIVTLDIPGKPWDTPQLAAELERSEEHTSELQSRFDLVCRLLLEKKKKQQ